MGASSGSGLYIATKRDLTPFSPGGDLTPLSAEWGQVFDRVFAREPPLTLALSPEGPHVGRGD